jgi:hypothetical protein
MLILGCVISVEEWRIINAKLKSPHLADNTSRYRALTRPKRAVLYLSSAADRLKMYTLAHEPGLAIYHFQALVNAVVKLNPAIADLMLKGSKVIGSMRFLDPSLMLFFNSCSRLINPLASFIPVTVRSILQDFVSGEQIVSYAFFHAVKMCAPLLSSVVGCWMRADPILKACVLKVLKDCFHRLPSCYPPTNPEIYRKLAKEELPTYKDDMDELLQTGEYFPAFPIHSRVTPMEINTSETKERCAKTYKKAGKYGAGTLLFWCLDHQTCLGFVVLKSAESCQSVFNVLATRFDPMPEIVVYDNACNLYEVYIF